MLKIKNAFRLRLVIRVLPSAAQPNIFILVCYIIAVALWVVFMLRMEDLLTC